MQIQDPGRTRIHCQLRVHHPATWPRAPRGYLNHVRGPPSHWLQTLGATQAQGGGACPWVGGPLPQPDAGLLPAFHGCALRDQRPASPYQMPLPVVQAPTRGRVEEAEEQRFLGACRTSFHGAEWREQPPPKVEGLRGRVRGGKHADANQQPGDVQ